jgi:hypothetical protein
MSNDEYPFDPLIQKLIAHGKKMEKQLSETKNPLIKAELTLSSLVQSFDEYFKEISNMSNDEYDKLIEQRMTILKVLGAEINKNHIKKLSSSGTIPMDEIGMFSILPQLEAKDGMILNRTLKKTSKENIHRLLSLELLSHFEMLDIMILETIKQDPLNRLETIVKRRFDADLNWGLAVMVLALHENLVKKKLIDLGMSQNDIDNFLKDKGHKFSDLVDHLATKINVSENRTVGLSFFKSSALREVRNRLEHEGYKQQLTHDEVLDLIHDVEKFERELFFDMKN